MTTAFRSWRALEAGPARARAGGAEADRGAPKLSRDVDDIVQRALAES